MWWATRGAVPKKSRRARRVRALPGGERNRLLLDEDHGGCPSNLLVLDEPTNDLDMDTLDLLQGNAGRL